MSTFAAVLGIALAPIAGGFVHGMDRWVRSRMQRRRGPPIRQPFFDVLKLLGKRQFIVHSYHALLAVAHLCALWTSVALLFLNSDLLMVIYFHLLATLLLIIAGYSVRSVYSNMGAMRELTASLTYEPVFVLTVLGLFIHSGSFLPSEILRSGQTTLAALPLIFVAFLVALPLKLRKSPFDVTEAHQEIVGGIEVEYSGLYKAVLLVSKWLDYIYVGSFLWLFSGGNILWGAGILIGTFLGLAAVDNATARVTYRSMNRITLPIVITLVVLNLLWLTVRRGGA